MPQKRLALWREVVDVVGGRGSVGVTTGRHAASGEGRIWLEEIPGAIVRRPQ